MTALSPPPLRVMILGDTSPGNGGECYAASFRRGGHIVEHHSDWEHLGRYLGGYGWRVYRHLTTRIYEPHRRAAAGRTLERVREFRPDVFIALGGLHLSGEDVRRIKATGAWTVNLNHDDFRSRYRLNKSRVQWRAVPEYDQILTTREVNVSEILPHNSQVEFFPFAYEPTVHRPVPIPPEEAERWDADVVFVGTHARHRAKVLECLVTAVPARYAIYGGGWKNLSARSPLRPFLRAGSIYKDDLCKAIGGSKVSLGFLRRENRDDYTQRTFEIPACGGVMLMERTPRQSTFFREGVEAEFFDPDDPLELFEKVRSLLGDEKRRERIRHAGQLAVRRMAHTYDDRIRRIREQYDSFRSGSNNRMTIVAPSVGAGSPGGS